MRGCGPGPRGACGEAQVADAGVTGVRAGTGARLDPKRGATRVGAMRRSVMGSDGAGDPAARQSQGSLTSGSPNGQRPAEV